MSTVAFFEKKLEQHGNSPKALDWSHKGQNDRFHILRHELGIRGNASVLDVGCGLGHFLTYLRDCMNDPFFDWSGVYEGIDASDKMITAAMQQTTGAHLAVRDALDISPLPKADFVVSSGMLNVAFKSERTPLMHMAKLMTKCFDAAKIACGINMLSSHTHVRHIDRWYYDPIKVLAIALEITPRVSLHHDYRDNDFTIILRKVL